MNIIFVYVLLVNYVIQLFFLGKFCVQENKEMGLGKIYLVFCKILLQVWDYESRCGFFYMLLGYK